MKFRDLFETPLSIEPEEFELDNKLGNIRETNFLMKNSKITIESFQNGEFTLYEFKTGYALIKHKSSEPNETVYLMQYTVRYYSVVGHECAQQIKVWRNRKYPITEGIAKYIFFSYLLKKWHFVITDSMQTPNGQGFWDNRVIDAFKLGFNVYYVDISKDEVIKINNDEEYREIIDNKQPWGVQPSNVEKKFLITTDII